MKRIICADQFNNIEGCYFADIAEHGHKPVSLVAESYNQIESTKNKVPVKIDKSLEHVISCHGGYYVTKLTRAVSSSPIINLKFTDEETWDKAITAIRAAWGNKIIVKSFTTINRETGQTIIWERKPVENGFKLSKLVLSSVNAVPFEDCKYQVQQKASGEMWEDTCEYEMKQRTVFNPACHAGSH